jgi:hypothetical protein
VIRTHTDPGTGPQFTYLPPHLAVDPFYHDALTNRRNQLLDVLEKTNDPTYPELVLEMIGDLDFINDTRDRWGEKSNEYRVKVLGEFPLAEARVLIAADLVDAAMCRDVVLNVHEPIVYGVDVARFGDDRSVICKRQGNVVLESKAQRGLDLMGTVGWVASEARLDAPSEIMVDSIGLGSGVADRLRELKFNVRDVNVAEATAMNLSLSASRRTVDPSPRLAQPAGLPAAQG